MSLDEKNEESPPAAEERGELQERISDWLDMPLSVLALVMLGLLLVELTMNLGPTATERIFQVQTAIWAVFVLTFLVELALAPSKVKYLRQNWLTAISVALPALRAVRILRVARALRGLSLVRILTTLNRSTRSLTTIVQRGQLGYVLMLTVIVTLTAAAGVFYFERGVPGGRIATLPDAVWWAAALVTTINSSLETTTFEGRVIGLLLRIFAVAVSGYITAVIAVYLLGGRPTVQTDEGTPSAAELRALRLEVLRLRALLEKRVVSGE